MALASRAEVAHTANAARAGCTDPSMTEKTCFETHHFPDGFEFPDPEQWYPGPTAAVLRSNDHLKVARRAPHGCQSPRPTGCTTLAAGLQRRPDRAAATWPACLAALRPCGVDDLL